MTATRRITLTLCALLIGVRAFAQAVDPAAERPPYSLAAEARIATRSAAPVIRDHWVVFSYKPTSSARYVAIRFEHERYAVLHPFTINENRVFVFLYRPPEGLGELTYRISVDGMWMRDPANPEYRTDHFGTDYSRLRLEGLAPGPRREPVVTGDGGATFTYLGAPGRIVAIAGSFNSWDPYVHVLEEIARGVYSITLRLPAGAYTYYFLENGSKRLDPANPELRHDSQGEVASYFLIP